MKRSFLKIIAVFLGLLLIAAIVITFTLDRILKSNIEQISSEILATEVTVDRVSISPLSGTGTIRGLRIANPEGFEDETALQIKSVHMELNLSSLLTEPVIVHLVEIEELDLSYQIGRSGSNLGKLGSNLSSHTETAGEGRQVIIERLLMDNTQLEIRVDLDDIEPVHLILDRFEQTNIGHDENNDLEDTLKILFEILLDEVESQSRAKLIEEGGSRILDEIENFFRELF
jgi:hypothetical protein